MIRVGKILKVTKNDECHTIVIGGNETGGYRNALQKLLLNFQESIHRQV